MKRGIDAGTRLVGLFGNPVNHSLSPLFMNYALEKLEINCRYTAFNILEENLPTAIDSLKVLNFRGINITIPYKSAVIGHLDTIDHRAEKIGAVNCIVNRAGRLFGYNTDYIGFLKPLTDRNFSIKGGTALIIGCGGAARAALYALISEGIAEVIIANRTEENALSFIAWCKGELGFQSISYTGDSRSITQDELNKIDIIVNATPVGMHPHTDDCSLTRDTGFRKHQRVYDLIYNPWETELLRRARRAGSYFINGFEMLIVQGIYSLSLWFPSKKEQVLSLQESILNFAKTRMKKR